MWPVFFCLCVLFTVGLITLAMRVSDFFWRHWRSCWTRNSESPHIFVVEFLHNVLFIRSQYLKSVFSFFFSGKSPLINATSINLSSVWRLSWTIRSVRFNRHKAVHTTDHPHKNLFSCRYEVILLWRNRKNLSEYTGRKCSPAEQWIYFTKK